MSALPVDPHLYLVFLGVMAVMAMTPGPANLFSIATGMERGRAAVLLGGGRNELSPPWSGSARPPSALGPW